MKKNNKLQFSVAELTVLDFYKLSSIVYRAAFLAMSMQSTPNPVEKFTAFCGLSPADTDMRLARKVFIIEMLTITQTPDDDMDFILSRAKNQLGDRLSLAFFNSNEHHYESFYDVLDAVIGKFFDINDGDYLPVSFYQNIPPFSVAITPSELLEFVKKNGIEAPFTDFVAEKMTRIVLSDDVSKYENSQGVTPIPKSQD